MAFTFATLSKLVLADRKHLEGEVSEFLQVLTMAGDLIRSRRWNPPCVRILVLGDPICDRTAVWQEGGNDPQVSQCGETGIRALGGDRAEADAFGVPHS